MPPSALFVRSADASFVFTPTATAIPTAATTVTASVHQVERNVRSLIHSIRATCPNPYCVRMAAASRVVVMTAPPRSAPDIAQSRR